jgi:1-deoxyxylulose-5-phosphate synthase
VYREEEREMIPLCLDQGVGLIPWSPIARGLLARPRGVVTARAETDNFQKILYEKSEAQDGLIIDAVEAVAKELGRPMAHVALAWLRQKPGVAAPIIGFTKPGQLTEAISGLDLTLSPEHIQQLEARYVPHAPAGF